MSDSGSSRDPFARRKTPAAKGLGLRNEAKPHDAFSTRANPPKSGQTSKGDVFAQKPKQDAFAPKAKRPRPPPALTGMQSHSAKAARKKESLPKVTKQAAPKTDGFGKVKPPKPVKIKPAAFAAPMAMKRAPANAARLPAPMSAQPAKPEIDMFGRPVRLSQTKAPPSLTPAMTTASGRFYNPFARKPAAAPLAPPPASPPVKSVQSPAAPSEPQAQLPAPLKDAPLEAETPQAAASVQADAQRAPLQLVANDDAEDAGAARPALKKFRRAARSSSLVLVSGMGAEAVAETFDDTFTMSAGDPDDMVADKPPAQPASAAGSPPQPPAGPPPPAEAASRPADPPPPPKPQQPETLATESPAPETPILETPAAEAALDPPAEPAPPVETVEATVEPSPRPPETVAAEPIAESIPEPGSRPAVDAQPEAVEAAWQPVEGAAPPSGRPAVGVLEKVAAPAAAGGFWGGATMASGPSPKAATRRRFFNQDDMFGLMLGLAVLVFVFMWLFGRKAFETPGEDELVTAQAAASQSAASVTPLLAAPPPPDPFGNRPVDLKPTGPVPETSLQTQAAPVDPSTPTISGASPAVGATPAPPSASAPSSSATATPPAAAVSPPNATPAIAGSALPFADRKMHAWFCTASARLTQPSRTALQGELAKFANTFHGQELVVRGYADTRGPAALNVTLGERRANAVAKLLRGKGLSVVDVQGVGELDGLDDNQDCSNQRRVDVWVKGGPAQAPSRACEPEPAATSLTCE